MGVKDLWKILAPVGRKTTLFELSNKTIAIDLSCWICENQIVGEKYVPMQSGMHLRNVFFRTSMLLMIGVTPVFVLDGKPPELKQDVLAKRKQARYKQQNKLNECKSKTNGTRSRLKFLLKQCKNMLEMMGLKCLESDGEGEALCAQLNRDGIVDGVITSDSDVFLYGARTVYRNFTLQGSNGSIEIFDMNDVEKTLNLTRDKLVALSLLCGCDYDDHGVHGVGKEKALKYLSLIDKGQILDRLRQWRTDKILDKYESQKSNCTKCCHEGKLKDHNKSGCIFCGTERGCNDDISPSSFKNLAESEKEKVNLELFFRKRALENPLFPEEEIISEFLAYNQILPKLNFTWRHPKIVSFIEFTCDSLEWELNYAFKKFLPLCARWQILNDSYVDLEPEKITKKKVLKGVPSFEILWRVKNENINILLNCNDHESDENVLEEIITVEPQALVIEKLARLHQSYTTEIENEKLRKMEEKKKVKSNKTGTAKLKKKENKKEKQPHIDSILKGMVNLSLNKEINCNLLTHKKKNDGDSNYFSVEEESATSDYDICNYIANTSKSTAELQNIEAKEKFNESSFYCANCDDSTVDYEINESLIVESILARKGFH